MNHFARYFTSGLLLLSATGMFAKTKHAHNQQPANQDQIDVVAHLPVTEGPITRFLETQHYRRDYLYAEHGNSKSVTLIDVTSANKPAQLAEMTVPADGMGRLVSATGTEALVSSGTPSVDDAMTPQTFRILSFVDPAHPAVKREFKNVTALARDDRRGLIFLANDEGIWILKQKFALSPEDEAFQKELEHTIYDTR